MLMPPTHVSQELGFPVDNGQDWSVEAAIGSINVTTTTSFSRFAAVRVDATLISAPGVWEDRPTVTVAAQVRDKNLQTWTLSSTVYFRVTPISFSGSAASGSCTTASKSGVCLSSISLPSSWFHSGADQTVLVSYALSSSGPFTDLATVTVFGTPSFPSASVGASLFLPLHDVIGGESFQGAVKAYAGMYSVNSFRISVNVASGPVQIQSINVNSSVWSAAVAMSSGSTFVVTAVLAAPETRALLSSGAETLFTVTFTTPTTVQGSVFSNITVEVIDLFDVKGRSVYLTTPSAGYVYSRDGYGLSGRVQVVENAVTGVFAYSRETEFVNTAVLDGVIVTSPIKFALVLLDGSLSTTVNGSATHCMSADSRVVKVAGNCLRVYLDGSETLAAKQVTISVTYLNKVLSMPVRVWYPDLPLSWAIDDDELNAISGWFDASNSCRQRYQEATLYVNATFRLDTGDAFSVDVTDFVRPHLQISNGAVLGLVAGANTVVGLSAGSASISSDRVNLGSLNVVVSSTPVSIPFVLGGVVSGLSLGAAVDSTDARFFNVTATVASTLVRDHQAGFVFVEARFSDTRRMQLSLADGLVLESINKTVVDISGDYAIAIGNGYGHYIMASWLGSNCSASVAVLGSQLIIADVILPVPIGIEVVVSAHRITLVGDVASTLSIPTLSTIQVLLVFADGHREDFSKDPRTVLTVLDPSILAVSHDANQAPLIVGAGGAGTGSLLVSFTHVDLSTEVQFVVVVAVSGSLFSTPYPLYPGSTSVNKTEMFYIGETGVSEELYVLFLIHLSDGSAVDVEGYSSSMFRTRDAQSDLVISLGAHGLKNVVSRQAGVGDGIAFIVGQYLTIVTPALEVMVSSQKVVISSFLSLSFPSTLHGVIGTKADVTFGIVLSDGTIWTATSLFDVSGHIVLAGLVTFSVSNTNVATVDSVTGVVTLLDNNFELNVLRVTSLDSSGQHTDFAFATNLDPAVGDIDLGEPLGLPLASMVIGTSFTVRVRAQLGLSAVRSIQLHVLFDTSRLQVVNVTQSASWSGGLFRSNLDVVGLANFGGSCDATSGLFEVALIQFKVIGTGIAAISGSVITLADGTGASIPSNAVS